jgi:hypothetical protein
MPSFHSATCRLLPTELRASAAAVSDVERAEQRLGFRLPASVREWYCNDASINILAEHSNQDRPLPLAKFVVKVWKSRQLLPFQIENQGVCTWSIMLDGTDDPPVYVDVDSNGNEWQMMAPTFSAYVYACVWDYEMVLGEPALAQAQNKALSPEAVNQLERAFTAQPRTFGWPGSTQYRFAGKDHAVLIWSAANQADWFVGAHDEGSLETALRRVWNMDAVGKSFYDCSDIAMSVLAKIRDEA